MLSPHHYNNICITKSQVISTNYGVFPTYICKSIHPMTKVTGVLDFSNKNNISSPFVIFTFADSKVFLIPTPMIIIQYRLNYVNGKSYNV